MVFVSRHDWEPRFDSLDNYHQMLGVPHRFTPEFWAARRQHARKLHVPSDAKVVTLFLGGSNGAYVYDEDTHRRIRIAVQDLSLRGWHVLVSVSRRSSAETHREMMSLTSETVAVWDRISENPFIDYVAAADAFLIAKDSVTMPCEALSTGKPVYSFPLTTMAGERLVKFERYHKDLQENLRLTRKYIGSLDPYDYSPPRETQRISEIIKRNIS